MRLRLCKSVRKKRGFPVDTGHKLNIHKTFRRRSGRLLNVLCTFNLRPASTELLSYQKKTKNYYKGRQCQCIKITYHLHVAHHHSISIWIEQKLIDHDKNDNINSNSNNKAVHMVASVIPYREKCQKSG